MFNGKARPMKWKPLMPLAALIVGVGAILTALNLSDGSEVQAAPPVTGVTVVRKLPHDKTSFSQGFVVHNGKLIEGTGQYQKSRLRVLDPESGNTLTDIALAGDVFGEGVTVWKDRILQLTWRNGYLIVYNADSLKQEGFVSYRSIDPTLEEGWGITHDGTSLIISDGSAVLRFVDPETFRVVRKLTVKNGFRTQKQLNELEFVNGEILANVWYSDQIARIDPATGAISGWLELGPLKPRELRFDREAVLNGIAWDSVNGRLFVTGKNWPVIYEIEPPVSAAR